MCNSITEKQLKYMEFIQRETLGRHHTHTEDMYQYDLLRMGNPKAVEEGIRIFSSNLPGHLSDDPLRNYKYLFVASITLASRSAILGGMDAERSYNISDLYIQKMDLLQSVDKVKALHADMFAFYTKEMAALDKTKVYSKPITQCINYIYNHLHETIHVKDLAAQVKLNESYLSTLFNVQKGNRKIRFRVYPFKTDGSRPEYAQILGLYLCGNQCHSCIQFSKPLYPGFQKTDGLYTERIPQHVFSYH